MVDRLEGGNAVLQTIQSCEDGRALKLLKSRQALHDQVEKAKQAIEDETSRKAKFTKIDDKYATSFADNLETEFAKETIGLVSAEEFMKKRNHMQEMIMSGQVGPKKEKEIHIKKVVQKNKLSFAADSEEEDEDSDFDSDDKEKEDKEEKEEKVEEPALKKVKFGKDPTVNTKFLADADRDAEIKAKRAELIEQYQSEQLTMKKEALEITYSYWDGSGHRRSVKVEKGYSIGAFLAKARKDLESDFPELKGKDPGQLIYVKEDLILPHHVTFYELIKNKARGKSGPLFHFDVHEDIRELQDFRVEKDEAHAGKIVDRKWYERNKHIFPASRWDVYDPLKTYSKYTIHGEADYSVRTG